MESNVEHSSQSFSYHYVLLGLTVYYAVEGLLKRSCRHFRPEFYEKLKADDRFLPFFGFAMGWLITLSSTPICLYAFITTDAATSLQPSLAGQICIASRSILWVSELNRLEYLSAFIKHHFGSLTHLMWHLHGEITLKPLYLIYASLATELFSTAAAILTIAGLKSTNSPLARRIQQANTIAVPLLRAPPVIYTAVNTLPQLTGLQHTLAVFFLGGYLWSFLRSTPRELKRLNMLPNLDALKTKLRSLNFFGMFASSAYWALVLSTLQVYSLSGGFQDRKSVSLLLLQAAVAGFFGARAPSILTTGGNLLSPTGYWLQSGIVSSALVILLTPFSKIESTERIRLLAAALVSLPLVEVLGRIGCHFAGCCGSSRNTSRQTTNAQIQKHISAPLLTSILSFLAYIGVMAAFSGHLLSLYQAAATSVGFQGFIRVLMEVFRSDVERNNIIRVKPTVAFAFAEIVVGLTYILFANPALHTAVEVASADVTGSSYIIKSLSLPAILVGLTQACAGTGMEAIESSSWILTLPIVVLSVVTQACSGSGMEALDPTKILAVSAPAILAGVAQACSGSGMEALDSSVLTLALPGTLLGLLTQACSSSGMEAIDKILPGSSRQAAEHRDQPLSSIQSCSGSDGGVEKQEPIHCGQVARL